MKPKDEIMAMIGTIQTEIDEYEQDTEGDPSDATVAKLNKLYDKQDLLFRQIGADPAEFRSSMRTSSPVPAGVINASQKTEEKPFGMSSRFGTLGEAFQAMAASVVPQGEYKYGQIGSFKAGSFDARLSDLRTRPDFDGFKAAATGANITVPSEGGFLTGQEMSNELLVSAFETGFLASRVRRRTLSGQNNGIKLNVYDETSRADGSRYGGVRSYWKGEADAFDGSKPKYAQLALDLGKLTGLYYATDELLQDAAALEQEIRDAFSAEFGFKIDDAILNGSGVGMPLGILQAPALVTIAKEAGQAPDTIVWENVKKMYARWLGSKSSGLWVMNRDTSPQLDSMHQAAGTAGVPVFLPAGGATADPYDRLKGMPLLEMEQAATLGDMGDLLLIDPKQYMWIDKGGFQGAVSIHVRFVNDEVVFRFVYRCAGQPIPKSAITPFKGADTRSPFVAIAAR